MTSRRLSLLACAVLRLHSFKLCTELEQAVVHDKAINMTLDEKSDHTQHLAYMITVLNSSHKLYTSAAVLGNILLSADHRVSQALKTSHNKC